MKTLLLTIALTLLSLSSLANSCNDMWKNFDSKNSLKTKYSRVKGKCDRNLVMHLQSMVRNSSSINYKQAKKKMYSKLDAQEGKVFCVYSDHSVRAGKVPNHRKMNAEHTWPKSKGAKSKPAVSDLHHLFPSDSKVNSRRSSYPFCEVSEVMWTNGMSTLGKDKRGTICFEPPHEHKGNVARAMMYFSTRYNKKIDSNQEKWFKKWHKEDPVDQMEIQRNEAISRIQRTTNPYIDQPELVQFIADF